MQVIKILKRLLSIILGRKPKNQRFRKEYKNEQSREEKQIKKEV